MRSSFSRRDFLQQVTAGVTLGGMASLASHSAGAYEAEPSSVPHSLTLISGNARERGRHYGQEFKDQIQAFLDREVYQTFIGKPSSKEEMLRFAAACGEQIRGYSPTIYDELGGVSEGAGLRFEEAVLITCHEELWHKGKLPGEGHCTAVAVGPPDTKDGHAYVGQTWDWMKSVFNLSQMLHWKRTEGPSVLSYAYPGLWCGAGLNSAGIALCWTSTKDAQNISGPRIGIPDYVLLTQLLYQETLQDVISEARRASHAGWFTFVLADSHGNVLNLEGSPQELIVEESRGHIARHWYGTQHFLSTGAKSNPRAQIASEHLEKAKGQIDSAYLENLFGDEKAGVCASKGTIDMMVFDCTSKTARVSRGASWGKTWQTFRFDSQE